MRLFLTLILALVSNVFCVSSYAQQRTEVLTFDNELIEGSLKQPELTYLLKRKNFNYKKLIKIRKDFTPEIEKTSEFVHRPGSGN